MFLGPTTRERSSSSARTEKHGQAERDAIIQLSEEQFFFSLINLNTFSSMFFLFSSTKMIRA